MYNKVFYKGILQGNCFTLLYSLYVNVLIYHISDRGIGCRVGGYSSNIQCFADGIKLLGPGANALEVLLGKVSSGLSELSLKMNPHKSAYIVFKRIPNVVLLEKITAND